MKKLVSTALLALSMTPAILLAQGPPPGEGPGPGPDGPGFMIRLAPPPPPHEHMGPPPGPDFVWIAGYQRWDGRGYGWVPGHYEQPPHPHAAWVPHRWQHRHGSWIMVEGHWR